VQEAVYRTILEQVEDGVYFVDLDRRITYWNAGAERITGYRAEEVRGHSCSEGILRHVTEGGYHLCTHGCPLAAVMNDGQSREASVYLHHKRGHRVPVVVMGSPIRNDHGDIVGSVEVFHVRQATDFATSHGSELDAAYRDPLTDLGNRRFVEAHVHPALVHDGTAGLLFMDLDHFKVINDTWGHSVGDAVLRMAGQTVAHGLRQGDWPIRWGGEEFVVIVRGARNLADLEITAERLRMLVEESWLDIDGHQVRITVSVGATMIEAGEDFAEALDRADRMMYASKAAGRNRVTSDRGVLPAIDQRTMIELVSPR
jgi:diguanylate cyclase (GGDEF)-like protein/PAS domain S-box-containing protein